MTWNRPCVPKAHTRTTPIAHVLFTNAFFDLMQQNHLGLSQGVDLEKVVQIASFHHQPDNSPDPATAWICTLADRYSAGMDRKAGGRARGIRRQGRLPAHAAALYLR